MASVDRRHRDEGKLVAACCHHRPLIIAAKKLVRDTLRMEQIFGVRSLPAQNAEDGLDEERRRDQLPVEKVSQGIEMPDIIAFKLETCANTLAARLDTILDILECITENHIPRDTKTLKIDKPSR